MSGYDKRRILRVYSDGKTYVLVSQLIEDQKLQIKIFENQVCVNKLTDEEWDQMRPKTNSRSSFVLLNEAFGCLGMLSTSHDEHSLLFVKDAVSVGTIRKFDILRVTDISVLPLTSDININMMYQQQNNGAPGASQHSDIKKFLGSGNFYFAFSQEPSSSFDLTLSSQSRNNSRPTEKKFLWNYNLHIPLRRLNIDVNIWLLKLTCGFIDIKKVFTLSKSFKACLFSRLSCERVGTRFNCRGINDDGNCANFVETEQVLFSEDSDEESSFLQLRGSVPVFFQQTGINVGTHRISVSRGIDMCYPAFERHMKSLYQDYGTNIYILNLLGVKGDESFLTNCFSHLCEDSPYSMNGQLCYTNFDYHQEMKLNRHALDQKMWSNLLNEFYSENQRNSSTENMFFYYKHEPGTDNINKLQAKFIRTNCMDCLDRTNNVQAFIGMKILTYQLNTFLSERESQKIRECQELFRQMWILNGDCISKIYAGTGAIQGRSVTQDISRSLTRAIQNNFLDNNKQDAIDTLLYGISRNYGDLADRVRILMSQNALRLPHPVLHQMIIQNNEYTKQIKCRVCVGTWNINGGLSPVDMESLDLNDWLIDGPINARKTGFGHLDSNALNMEEIDIFCVGFEEICDLSAQNIVSASDENSRNWYNKLFKFLQKHGEYVPVIIEPLQLVGVCIFVFVLKKHVNAIRDVCIAKTKTGMGGAAGNKGGVLVRMIFYNTSMCFVCSHFAAHQKEIQQRNEDFKMIYEKSEFQGQAVTSTSKIDVKSHDYVFWCGDLNYRIDMENQRCRNLITECAWKELLEQDQLGTQHARDNVFREFNEAPISFPPTYKYNLCEDTYDRSEKCRVPAWTDRVLWRRRKLKMDMDKPNFDAGKCLYYGRADIRLSDHKPVSGLIEIEVNKVVPKKQIEVLHKVLKELAGPFQVILKVKTHTNIMNEMVKVEVQRLFSKFKSYAMLREYKSCLYVTYADGRYAYDAMAQLNNFYIEKYDITLLIKVDFEDIYSKLYEQEVWDCFDTLYYARHVSNHITNEESKNDVDLLNLSFKEDDSASNGDEFNAPAHIHSSLSIYHNMHTSNTNNNLDAHNPLIKALSNSNLNDFDPKYAKNDHIITRQHSKQMHSETNLLDISNEEISITPNVPPKRPPPPIPPNPFQQQNEPKLIDISSNGFDDDFSKVTFTTTTKSEIASNRPPPLPPFPSKQQETYKTPFFTLSSQDSYSSNDPFSSITSQQQSIIPPPLPPMPPNLQSSIRSSVPPPLPPLPAMTKSFSKPLEPQRPAPPQRPTSLVNPQLDPFGNSVFNPPAQSPQNSSPWG